MDLSVSAGVLLLFGISDWWVCVGLVWLVGGLWLLVGGFCGCSLWFMVVGGVVIFICVCYLIVGGCLLLWVVMLVA